MALFCAIRVVSKTHGRVSSPLSSGHDSSGSFFKKSLQSSFIHSGSRYLWILTSCKTGLAYYAQRGFQGLEKVLYQGMILATPKLRSMPPPAPYASCAVRSGQSDHAVVAHPAYQCIRLLHAEDNNIQLAGDS